MSIWSVIGSRCLPRDWESRVSGIVDLLLSRGHRICSGGAIGTDLVVLRRLVQHGASACRGSLVYLPGDTSLVPDPCNPWLDKFLGHGGQVVEGSATDSSSRQEFVSALLIRNCYIVRASAGVVAFVSHDSPGSWFTVEQAIRRDVPAVAFPIDGQSCLRHFASGSWVPSRSLAGAYVFNYIDKP